MTIMINWLLLYSAHFPIPLFLQSSHLFRDGVCAIELEDQMGVVHVLDREDGVLGVLLGQSDRLAGFEHLP